MDIPFPQLCSGLANELASISLMDVTMHLRNYCGNFLLDEIVNSAYINRLVKTDEIWKQPGAISALHYCLRKYVKLLPFSHDGLKLLGNFERIPDFETLEQLLRPIGSAAALEDRVTRLGSTGHAPAARRILLDVLAKDRHTLWAAERLLSMDLSHHTDTREWLPIFSCPPPLARTWELMLLRHFATAGDMAEAAARLGRLGSTQDWPDNETVLNTIAEVLAATGDAKGAMAAYERSLALDPLQAPVGDRLRELRSPLVPNYGLLDIKDVNIYLYSYNKADFLEKTLKSLAETDIGRARIKVLLNGCSDDSLERVQALGDSLFRDRLEIVPLRVNVGAPAARNWLIADPDTAQADYTAFLDDDVELPKDWLASFLTVMEANPKAGVVGCRILQPGTPTRIQYLYRNVCLALPTLVRLSLDHPNRNFNTELYAFTRKTETVMGCCHMFRRQALLDAPQFDLRFSPTQMDDIAHDIDLRLLGYDILYCGQVRCIHHQNTGNMHPKKSSMVSSGNTVGNDVKFYYRFLDRLSELGRLRNPGTIEDFQQAVSAGRPVAEA